MKKNAARLTALALAAALVAGCGGGKSGSGGGGSSGSGGQVLPVARNPISNSSRAPGLTIPKALVENNVSPATGKPVDDHLEIELKNTSPKPLDQIGVYYRISDPKKATSEGYYAKLAGVTIPPGATRTIHFDGTGARDHYPVNKYSLYYTDGNALVVDVTASSPGVKPATFTVRKDAVGSEAGVE